MTKINYLIIYLLVIFIFLSCGGTIGNIEKYRIKISSVDSLKSIVKQVNLENPELRQYDTTIYREGKSGLGEGEFYCTIKDDEDHQKYLFAYSYVQYEHLKSEFVDIALTYAGKYGDQLKLERELGFFEKRKYKEMFEKYFIAKVRNHLSSKTSNMKKVKTDYYPTLGAHYRVRPSSS